MSVRSFEILGKVVGLALGVALLLIVSLYTAEYYGPTALKGKPRVLDQWVYHPIAWVCGLTNEDMVKARENIFGKPMCIDGSTAPDEWTRKVRNQRLTREREKMLAGGNQQLLLTPPTFTFPKK